MDLSTGPPFPPAVPDRGRTVSDPAWNGYLTNLGVWTGNRALTNPRGKVLIDLPSRVTVERFQTSAGDHYLQWRTTVRTADGIDTASDEWSRGELANYAALAADGCFSVGARAFTGEAVTIDNCIVADGMRVRTTHAFDWEGCLSGVVATRERLTPSATTPSPSATATGTTASTGTITTGTTATSTSITASFAGETSPQAPPPLVEPAAWRNPRILLDYTVGLWDGRGISIDARSAHIHTLSSRLKLTHSSNAFVTESSVLRIGDAGPTRVFEATGRLDTNFILFAEANVQTLLLPGGVIVSSPVRIRRGRPFAIETSLLVKPDCRKRVLRLYNRDSEWINTVFVNERRAG